MLNLLPEKKVAASDDELLRRCVQLSGMSFGQLSLQLKLKLPPSTIQGKGWIGQALERALGADGANLPVPDFQHLGIELKTLPIGDNGTPVESTFITSIPLLSIHQEQWFNSQCYSKLKKILWIPIEGDARLPYSHRRIGQGFIWSPSKAQECVLQADWDHLTSFIATGKLETLDATIGDYLQIRPKAADARSLCFAFDALGNKVRTLPRGFYLRRTFTAEIYKTHIHNLINVGINLNE